MLYIFIDPDDNNIELIELENLDVDTLCDLLRCDATDAIQLPLNFTGYIDGEGAWQGRQKEWELNDESYWGPMLIFKEFDEYGTPNPCTEEDLNKVFDLVHFWDE